MKKTLIFIIFIFSFLNFVFWDNKWTDNLIWSWNLIASWEQNNCSWYKDMFSIIWSEKIRILYPLNFSIKDIQDISWIIYKNWQKVFSSTWNILSYSFKSHWKVLLQANFKYNMCDIEITKKLNIYDQFVISLIEQKDTSIIDSLWEKQNIYYKNFSLEDIFSNKNILDMSDYIIINQNDVVPFLIKLWDDKKNYNDKKFIFLVSSAKWFFSRLIIPYIKGIDKNNIYIYTQERFLEIFTNIYQWKNLDNKNLLSFSNVWDKIYFPLSYFVNKLIENQFNIEILWIVLLALFWTLVITFFRQIIWFSVFWVYTPLIFSILIITLWYNIALLLFLVSILSSIITYFITKKIYILYSAKISLNYIIYIILSIIFIWFFVSYFNFNLSQINYSDILPFFIMPFITKNLIKDDIEILSKKFLLFILEFIFIIILVLTIFNISLLKYMLVAYPDIILLFIIIVILIGRFTWLQLLEYIRFYPLIKKNLEEEE